MDLEQNRKNKLTYKFAIDTLYYACLNLNNGQYSTKETCHTYSNLMFILLKDFIELFSKCTYFFIIKLHHLF